MSKCDKCGNPNIVPLQVTYTREMKYNTELECQDCGESFGDCECSETPNGGDMNG